MDAAFPKERERERKEKAQPLSFFPFCNNNLQKSPTLFVKKHVKENECFVIRKMAVYRPSPVE